jgi:hypothetical protein
MCVLLANALVVVTVDGAVAVAIVRGAIHGWRNRRRGLAVAGRDIGPALCWALLAATMQRAAAAGLFRAVDTGTAAAWLERSERWLSAKGMDSDEP